MRSGGKGNCSGSIIREKTLKGPQESKYLLAAEQKGNPKGFKIMLYI